MNCQELELLITDLARAGGPEADESGSALAHINQCRRCSERLAEEKRLTDGLLAWNAACSEERAQPGIEQTLRAAFRRNAAPAPRRRWLTFAAAGSIASAIVLFKLLTPAPAPPPRRELVAAAPAPGPPEAGGPSDSPARPARRKRLANRLPHVPPAEVGTGFIPVDHGDEWTPLDGGRLVRVRLPRSAMSVFGLPVDPGLAPERVQADVVLSDDGLLRAIRFVR